MSKTSSRKFIRFIPLAVAFMLAFCSIPNVVRISAQNDNITAMWLDINGEQFWYESPSVTLTLNGNELTNLPMEPVILYGRTFVGARALFEAMGGLVDWRDETWHIYIGLGYNLAVLQIGNTTLNFNGTEFEMDVAPKLINGHTMVPARFATEAFGFDVEWDEEMQTISITTN